MAGLTRLMNEYNELHNNPLAEYGVSVGLYNENDLYVWRCTIQGPKDTSFSGGLFTLKIIFPKEYPYKAPEVIFVTPIYHLNVHHVNHPDCPLGHVCMSTLNFWNSSTTMREVLTKIYALFYLANKDSPFGIDRQAEMINNGQLYEEKVKYFTEKYANPSSEYYVDEQINNWDFSYPKK